MKFSRNMPFLVCMLPAILSANVVYQDYSVSRLQATDLSSITGGACYGQMDPTTCQGGVALSSCSEGEECVFYFEDNFPFGSWDCERPDQAIPLPSPCSHSGRTRQFAIENRLFQSVSPAPPGPNTWDDRGTAPEPEPCQVVYNCECFGSFYSNPGICLKIIPRMCVSDAAAYDEFIMGNPCDIVVD